MHRDRLPLALLWLTIVGPMWLVLPGFEHGRVVFALYREPKLAIMMTAGWLFLTAFLWSKRQRLPLAEMWSAARRPAVLLLTLLVLYLTVTLAWIMVPANGAYELRQWFLLVPLIVVLVAWSSERAGVASTIRCALCTGAGVITALGFAQAADLLPFLPPINPFGEVGHPSLMGYKNPAALAVLGQVFLLLQVVAWPDRGTTSPRRTGLLGLLLIAEVVYLFSLQSRTAFAALLVGTAILAGALTLLRRSRSTLAFAGIGLLVCAGLTAAVLVSSSGFRNKASSVVDLAVHPSRYFETDRGVYLRNTLNMAQTHPFGVGVGEWQTHYPVFRKHGRNVAFTLEHQARRAHSDFVQMLGEGGWPGFALLVGFLVAAIAAPARWAWVAKDPRALCIAVQLLVVVFAMAFDYLIELPSHKMLLAMLTVLALSAGIPETSDRRQSLDRRCPMMFALAITMIATIHVAYSGTLMAKVLTAAKITRHHTAAISASPQRPPDHGAMQQVAQLGERMARTPGHTKSLFREYLRVAHSWHLLGRDDVALVYLSRSLVLAPYHPNAMRLAAVVVSDPELAARWQRASDYVLDEAEQGFGMAYPELSPVPGGRPVDGR